MLEGAMLLWFILTALSVLFVAVDIRSTPEHPVLKWAFVLITAYIGPLGAFLYVLGCREPLPGLHERYVAVRWRQVLGSTMHCVAGDGIGILTGAVVGSLVHMPFAEHVALEYVLGFAFGWTVFQALFMRGTAAGSYTRALAATFVPELLSMNLLMAGMVPAAAVIMRHVAGSHDPLMGAYWFTMSMALLVGFATAYPMNWWLVANRLKHGMMTVRPARPRAAAGEQVDGGIGHELHADPRGSAEPPGHSREPAPGSAVIARMVVLSFLPFGLGLGVAWLLGSR